MNMAYAILFIAIIAEVIGTSALKLSDGFTKAIPSVVVVVGYGFAFYFLSIVLRSIPVGIAYAIWAGVGIALIAIVGVLFFNQTLDVPAIAGIALIVAGVLVINLFSESTLM